MLIRRPDDVKAGEITSPGLYLRRRELFVGAACATAGALLPGVAGAAAPEPRPLPDVKKGPFGADEEPTSYRDATRYNNFYEFGTGKTDPERYAASLRPRPWSVNIEGEVATSGSIGLEDLLRPHPMEERIYRLRCVEAWSMVIPWIGIPLGAVLARFQPTSNAKYVAFATLHDPQQMPGQRRDVLDWPYVEGLRIDEATHPLAILAVGMYGRELPNQNGAPLRLVVPWKYGFKSIKSIVAIRLTRNRPPTSWNLSAPREYGFYSNVNPKVDHPRWSQKRERRIGDFRKRDTLMFNGYADQVAHLYAGMDLAKEY